jgi:hypothetical protein
MLWERLLCQRLLRFQLQLLQHCGDDVLLVRRGRTPGRPAPARALVAAIALLVAGASAAVAAPPAPAPSPADEAEALIRQGIELRHQNQDARALPLFERAYQVARNPRTAAQLGLAKMALGYWIDSERLLDEALAAHDHPWIARNTGTLEQARATARKSIGELVVDGAPAGAEILINGHPAGTLPLPAPIRLDKGPVELQIRAPAHTPVSRSLQIAGGARQSLSVTLERVPGPPDVATGTPRQEQQPRPAAVPDPVAVARHADAGAGATPGGPSILRPVAWTAAAGAAAVLVFGIVETVIATNRIDDFNNHTGPTPTDPSGRAYDCATSQLSDPCRSLRDASDRAKTLAVVGYVGAGALAATSAALFLLSSHGHSPQPRSDTALACAPALPAAGVTCRLQF